ncbi:Na/Pi cotransporter family protein [Roseimarinus sediminis]|jgi:phosphate:Na+ symporter|uniref:Na/Pi cotransporter family protein n=1 Tax=Roseimarinus sediminis TaxID=1610899 RepID=UPI003D1C2305
MDIFILLLTIAGATALFLYGMKLMSESLQKILGERIRLILTSMTSNKFKGVMTGLFITALIQSSSATTVMVVSFVNAGILRLFEAVSIIMGANIGTTFTAWLIAFFGFKIEFSLYTLPLIGLSIPFLFSNRRKVKNWGEMLLGFSLLFIALSFLKAYLPGAGESLVGNFVLRLTGIGYFSYLLFLLLGTVITMLIRSSNAILALTLVLVFNGWIGFEHAAAMVLGENIGTTIAAITAARVANLTAKRAAMAHLFFNLFGVIWVILVFPFFLKGVAMLYMSMGGGDPFGNKESVPIALALFHTLFNVINALLLSGFSGSIARFVTRRVTPGPNYDNEFRLTHIKIGLLSTPDASLYQAKRETVLFAERVRKMFLNVERAFSESNEKEFQKLIEKIHDDEEFANRLEKEIAKYLTSVGEGRLSENSSRRMRSLFKMIDDIESIADSCVNIANAIQRKRNAKINFPDSINYNVQLIFNMVRAALDMMVTMLTHNEELPLSMAQETEREINNYRDILKSEHLNNLEKGLYKYDAGIIYNDIISQCERIGDFAINVDEAQNNLY